MGTLFIYSDFNWGEKYKMSSIARFLFCEVLVGVVVLW